jgi:hypothetical protein
VTRLADFLPFGRFYTVGNLFENYLYTRSFNYFFSKKRKKNWALCLTLFCQIIWSPCVKARSRFENEMVQIHFLVIRPPLLINDAH